MVRTQIQLSERQSAALKKLAATKHVSIAELIRRAVDNMIGSGATLGIAEKRKRALAVVGRFSSGKRDTAKGHDKYLAEVYSK